MQVAWAKLEALLQSAPSERSGAGISLELPMPDGSFQQFIVEESPVMEMTRGHHFDGISTYSAVARNSASVTRAEPLGTLFKDSGAEQPQGSTPVGPVLRTYRIAVAATGEYTQTVGDNANHLYR